MTMQITSRLPNVGTTIFSTMSALAAQHGAVNLGQGFPDFDGPEEVREAAIHAIRSGVNQYAVTIGALSRLTRRTRSSSLRERPRRSSTR